MTIRERATRTNDHRVLDVAGQIVLLGFFWMVYALGRHLFEGSPSVARRRAQQIWDLERGLKLPDEGHVQHWVIKSHDAVTVVNFAYKYVHFPVVIVTLLVLVIRRRDIYVWIRNVLMLTTGLALIGHVIYPLAPPRLETNLGVVDTGLLFGESAYPGRPGTGLTNQFAAMPSMHVAWAAIVAIAAVMSLRSTWRWLATLYPFAMLFVVVVTGNHYWMDGIVGLACLAVAVVFVPRQPKHAPRGTPAVVLLDEDDR